VDKRVDFDGGDTSGQDGFDDLSDFFLGFGDFGPVFTYNLNDDGSHGTDGRSEGRIDLDSMSVGDRSQSRASEQVLQDPFGVRERIRSVGSV
jgi:hypothetical protein